ncbi:uncharacterized protein MONOS_1732 [Monocercomonoides exilis]|uniref:uncharacterized protein n=1 Tax=Monocercomonoides exilis TaxID=2049356 RepID=UPI00355A239E|nr:hypothetical protein MONOS_1732 [Monocercomonoides exilis]|eukprot:MONOS_1732.1-p1 / transcript=MONOS_1732.1 / gene=MONOS_1732 / organism=Monocercomonoides_exilis_PA203 / gene_product=unspecified product / transcript_product=unspecified product / location=Mono_scaffold00032:81018-82195(-) / protein_length=278 / sequence_SO=supercontig / SO=protein_coding / is_pseudo=false
MSGAESMTLLDAVESKLKDTKRVPFVSRVVLCGKVVDRQITQDHDIADYFEKIIPDLPAVRRGATFGGLRGRKVLPTGILLLMPNAIVLVVESTYLSICDFLRTFALHQELAFPTEGVQSERAIAAINAAQGGTPFLPRGSQLITSVRILHYTDDIPERAFTSWTAHSISKHISPDPDMLGITEKLITCCLQKILALGNHARIDSLSTPDTPPASDALIRVCEENELPSNEVYLNLTQNTDLPTLDEWVDIYAGVIDIQLEDEFTWPAMSTLNLLPL